MRGIGCVQLLDRELGAVLAVLAVVGLRSGQRRGEADPDDLTRLGAGREHGEYQAETEQSRENSWHGRSVKGTTTRHYIHPGPGPGVSLNPPGCGPTQGLVALPTNPDAQAH